MKFVVIFSSMAYVNPNNEDKIVTVGEDFFKEGNGYEEFVINTIYALPLFDTFSPEFGQVVVRVA